MHTENNIKYNKLSHTKETKNVIDKKNTEGISSESFFKKYKILIFEILYVIDTENNYPIEDVFGLLEHISQKITNNINNNTANDEIGFIIKKNSLYYMLCHDHNNIISYTNIKWNSGDSLKLLYIMYNNLLYTLYTMHNNINVNNNDLNEPKDKSTLYKIFNVRFNEPKDESTLYKIFNVRFYDKVLNDAEQKIKNPELTKSLVKLCHLLRLNINIPFFEKYKILISQIFNIIDKKNTERISDEFCLFKDISIELQKNLEENKDISINLQKNLEKNKYYSSNRDGFTIQKFSPHHILCSAHKKIISEEEIYWYSEDSLKLLYIMYNNLLYTMHNNINVNNNDLNEFKDKSTLREIFCEIFNVEFYDKVLNDAKQKIKNPKINDMSREKLHNDTSFKQLYKDMSREKLHNNMSLEQESNKLELNTNFSNPTLSLALQSNSSQNMEL